MKKEIEFDNDNAALQTTPSFEENTEHQFILVSLMAFSTSCQEFTYINL
jgi:hypothetical protein